MNAWRWYYQELTAVLTNGAVNGGANGYGVGGQA